MTKKKITTAMLAVCFAGAVWAQPGMSEWRNASEQHPVNVTAFLQNASGTENSKVWHRHSADAASGYNKKNTEFASAVYSGAGIESWYKSAPKNAELIWQDLNVMPGTYRVTAYVAAQVYNDESIKGQNAGTVYLHAGNGITPFTYNKWGKATVVGQVRGGEPLRIGIYAGHDNANDWVSIAQVKVECLGVNPGDCEQVTLSENYDACALREASYADFTLEKYLQKKQWSAITLPCSLDEEEVKRHFAKVLIPGKLTVNGTNATLEASPTSTMQAGKPYLVQPRTTVHSLTFNGTMGISELQATPTAGWTPNYRLRAGLANSYVLDTMKGKAVLRRVGANEPVKGFSAYLNDAQTAHLKSTVLKLTIVEK